MTLDQTKSSSLLMGPTFIQSAGYKSHSGFRAKGKGVVETSSLTLPEFQTLCGLVSSVLDLALTLLGTYLILSS